MLQEVSCTRVIKVCISLRRLVREFAKHISVRETYLGFDNGDTVSGEYLRGMTKHYKLDTILRCVDIPSISVKWDDYSSDPKKMADDWGCVGRTDFFMIFHWLKKRAGVKKVVEVVVEDFDTNDMSHSYQAIEACLEGLNVETWNWRRMDIPSDLIYKVAMSVSVVYLYCSGSIAVLRSWSDINGLARLKNVSILLSRSDVLWLIRSGA